MRARRREMSLAVGLVTVLMLVTLPAASALASAKLRLVNARGGSDPVRLEVAVGGQTVPAGAATAFGQAGDFADVPAGQAELSLTGGAGSGASARVERRLEDGASYTAIALPRGTRGFSLQVLRNGEATARRAQLRVVHAAPELGSPDIRVGRRTIAQGVGFRTATEYLTLDAGSYEVAVTKPNGGDEVFSRQVPLAAGSATTVVIAGSGGTAARAIVVGDDSVRPAGAPATGLGGLADGAGRPWALALLAALAAGALGGVAQLARSRRSRP